MAPRWAVSIRFKILMVLSALLIAAVSLYLFVASRISVEDKLLLIYELNQTQVRTLGLGVEAKFNRVAEKLRILPPSFSKELALQLFGEDSEVLTVRRGTRELDLPQSKEYFSFFGGPVKFNQELPPAWEDQRKIWIQNLTSEKNDVGPAVYRIARVDHGEWVSADLRLDRLAEAFQSSGVAHSYMVDSLGKILVRGDAQFQIDDPLIRMARESKVRSEVKRMGSDLGAYFKLAQSDAIVASKTQLTVAYDAARILIKKSILYALIVITAAFLVALFFSHSLTVPIRRLVDATRQIAQGNFNLVIPVSTRDELAVLATSFNSMTADLRSSRQQIEEYSRGLEKKVQERTVAIKEAQEALVRTTRLASVGEVAGRAAHEVLNPLTSISTRLEKLSSKDLKRQKEDSVLLSEIVKAWNESFKKGGSKSLIAALDKPSSVDAQKTLLQEDLENLIEVAQAAEKRLVEQQSDFEMLLRECGRINKIVNGMRQLTRVSGERKKVNIHSIIEQSFENMSDLFSKCNIAFEKNFCSENAVVYVDRDEMIQVFTNLFRNSLQALSAPRPVKKEGTVPKLWVSTRIKESHDRQKSSQNIVEIRIGDNGPGISNENISLLFESHFTTKGQDEGTGLGLSIARRFARAYEGELAFEKSAPFEETVFILELPIGDSHV